jgi:hypothetical protein
LAGVCRLLLHHLLVSFLEVVDAVVAVDVVALEAEGEAEAVSVVAEVVDLAVTVVVNVEASVEASVVVTGEVVATEAVTGEEQEAAASAAVTGEVVVVDSAATGAATGEVVVDSVPTVLLDESLASIRTREVWLGFVTFPATFFSLLYYMTVYPPPLHTLQQRQGSLPK